jgi:hypothetical protein
VGILRRAYAELEAKHPETFAYQRLKWWMERLSLVKKPEANPVEE